MPTGESGIDESSTPHGALAGRAADQLVSLAAQLASGNAAARADAYWTAVELVRNKRGDHRPLIMLFADRLDGDGASARSAARALAACGRLAEPARESLAAFVASRGPDGDRQVRRARRIAGLALARLGDARGLPGLLAVLDEDPGPDPERYTDAGSDAREAVRIARHLPQCAEELAPRLRARLAAIDIESSRTFDYYGMGELLATLAELADAEAVPLAVDVLQQAVGYGFWMIAADAARCLGVLGARGASGAGAFGPPGPADAALPLLRSLLRRFPEQSWYVADAALVAVWRITGDPYEVLPALDEHFQGPRIFELGYVAPVIGELGPAGGRLVPRLREVMDGPSAWDRVHAAAVLWRLVGDSEAVNVLETLFRVWDEDRRVVGFVVAALEGMGPAAAPAVSRLRAEVAEVDRESRLGDIDADEDLLRRCRQLVDVLG